MTKAFPCITLLVLAVSPASAQDWRAQLKADAVVIRGAKMIYDEVGLYKLNVAGYEPAQAQVKVRGRNAQLVARGFKQKIRQDRDRRLALHHALRGGKLSQ